MQQRGGSLNKSGESDTPVFTSMTYSYRLRSVVE